MKIFAASLVLLFAVSSFADVPPGSETDEMSWCGTSPERLERLRTAADAARVRGEVLRAKGRLPRAGVTRNRGVFLVDADPVVAPFDKPVDLQGTTLRFRRVDDTTFTATREPLQYSDTVGTLVKTFAASSTDFSHAVAISGFTFPFYDGRHQTLHVTRENAVYFAAPADRGLAQHGPLQILEELGVPMLSPLMTGSWGAPPASIFVHEEPSLIRITTRTPMSSAGLGYDTQITLTSNGDITFSYRTVTLPYGSVIVASGKASWRANRSLVASMSDAADDAFGGTAATRAMVDITAARVYRNSGTDLLELEVDLRSPVNRTTFDGTPLRVQLLLSYGELQYLATATIRATTQTLTVAGVAMAGNTSLVTVDGATVRFPVSQQLMPPAPDGNATVRIITSVGNSSDDTSAAAFLGATENRLETDFSTFEARTTSLPLVEAFTLTDLNVYAIWERIRDQYGLTDDEVDQVAIYQNFHTDLVTYAGGYSTVGNSGADGVTYRFNGSTSVREPALLHLDKIGYGWNTSEYGRTHLIHHEMGHRWLLFARIREGASDSSILGAQSHPAQWVHMPAAFPIASAHDASSMGGGYFIENADGTFTRSPEQRHAGYTWWELYLMGLASPAEVPSWFYIAGSNPPLGAAYYAPAGTYSGTKVPVTIGQLTTATGTRAPSAARAQKRFRTLYVIVQRPEQPVTEPELTSFIADYVDRTTNTFVAATGGRGAVTSSLPEQIVASFAAASRVGAGQPVFFTDTSSDVPVRWQWTFSDGATSTEQHPVRIFTTPGRYTVTLTAWNSRGSSTATSPIEVTPPPLLYHALAPCRAHDTRLAGGALQSNSFRAFQIAGRCGVPATARAISANFTVTNLPSSGYLSVYPENGTLPREVSTLNFDAGLWALANSAIVPLRADGGITAYAASSSLDLVIDVNGYFSDPAESGGLMFQTLTPCRVQDSRTEGGLLLAGTPRAMSVAGRCGVPAAATAVAANVTVTGSTGSGYLRVYPEEGLPQQESSLINFSADQWALANSSILRLRPSGAVTSMANVAATHALVDVSGWFGPSIAGGMHYYAVSPCRLFDTRSTSRMAANTWRSFTAGGRCGIPPGARAITGNLTVTSTGGSGYASLYSHEGPPAGAVSAINYSASQWALANSAIVPLREGGLFTVFVANASADVIFDVSGYFE